MTDRIFVDTTIWVYAVDGADSAKQRIARAIIAPSADSELVLSTQVLSEFFSVVTRKLAHPVPPEVAAAAIGEMARFEVVAHDVALVQAGIALCIERRISPWDAMIVVAARAAGCAWILSEDLADGADFGSVKVRNPFRAA